MNAFHRLSRREKVLVLVALPLVALFAGYRFVWVPLNEARLMARAEIREYQTLIEAAENLGNRPAERESVAVVTVPLATRITESAELAGVLVRRLEPEGAVVRVSLDDAPYETVVNWVAKMESDAAIALVAIELDRRTAPGIVAARRTKLSAPRLRFCQVKRRYFDGGFTGWPIGLPLSPRRNRRRVDGSTAQG